MKRLFKPLEKIDGIYILECGMFNVVFPDLNNRLMYKEIIYNDIDNKPLKFIRMEDAITFCNTKNSL